MTDRVQVLKQESAALGGDAADEAPYFTPIEPQEDLLESAGIYVQDASNRDETVYIDRYGADLRLHALAGSLIVAVASIIFPADIAAPSIFQADLATVPQTLLIHAGDVTATGAGSALDIRPGRGIGSGVHGQLALQDGGGADRIVVDYEGVVHITPYYGVYIGADVSFLNTVSTPTISQQSVASPTTMTIAAAANSSTGNGSDLDLKPGTKGSAGAHGQLALQDGGGADRIYITTSGSVVINGAATTTLQAASQPVLYLASTAAQVQVSSLRFGNVVTSPVIYQENHTSGNGQTMLIRSQNAFASATPYNGGDLDIRPGAKNAGAGSAHGQLALQDGGGTDRIIINATGNLTLAALTSTTISSTSIIIGGSAATAIAMPSSSTVYSLSLRGQNSSIAAGGGDLYIDPGVGTATSGSVLIRGGPSYTFRIQCNNTGIGFFAATPIAQPTSGGETIGYLEVDPKNIVYIASTFTGNVGATAYTLGDIVKGLKRLGLLTS